MSSPVETAVNKYIQAWIERDPIIRAGLIEACFAADGRIVSRTEEARGRAGLTEAIERFAADPQWRRVRILGAIDAVGTIFRFRAAIDRHDGTSLVLFDAGEIDNTGRIALILTFVDSVAETALS